MDKLLEEPHSNLKYMLLSSNHLRDGWIYFIRQDNLVKVGYTRNFEQRLSALRVSMPYTPHILGKISATRKHEKDLHKFWREYRVRGEWFKLPSHIIRSIEMVCEKDTLTPDGRYDGFGTDPFLHFIGLDKIPHKSTCVWGQTNKGRWYIIAVESMDRNGGIIHGDRGAGRCNDFVRYLTIDPSGIVADELCDA